MKSLSLTSFVPRSRRPCGALPLGRWRWLVLCVMYCAVSAPLALAQENPAITQARAQLRAGNGAEAFQAFRRLAEAGNAEANRWVGFCYSSGQGVPKDMNAALAWYRRAEAGGDIRAVGIIGLIYQGGEAGLQANVAEANARYRRAADAGDAIGQHYLAFNYENGLGLPKDRATAVRYYRLAATQGLRESQDALARLGEPVAAPAAAPPLPTTPPATASGNGAIAAAEVEDAFNANAAAAQARFKGKTITVTGKINYARLNLQGEPFVSLAGNGDDYLTCNFPPAAKGTVTALRAGQTVTIRGVCETMGTGKLHQLNNCELMR